MKRLRHISKKISNGGVDPAVVFISAAENPHANKLPINSMTKTLLASILSAFAVTYSASAVTITSFQPNVAGTPADVTFEGFADGPTLVPISILPGATLEYDGAVIVQADTNGNGAVPFPFSPSNGDYLSVRANGEATFAFDSDQSSFGFQWGSIDEFNTINFYLDGILQDSFTGLQVAQAPVFATGNKGENGSAFVTFGGTFDKVVLTSTQNSFEIDNVSVSTPVPDGGMTVTLLGLSLSGLAFFRRKLA